MGCREISSKKVVVVSGPSLKKSTGSGKDTALNLIDLAGLCVHVRVHMCACAYVRVCMCACVHVHGCVRARLRGRACESVCVCVCVCVCACARAHAHVFCGGVISYGQRRRDDNKNKVCVFEGGGPWGTEPL